jgi:hypothetical protein
LNGFSGRFIAQKSPCASDKKKIRDIDSLLYGRANYCLIRRYAKPYVSAQMRPLVHPDFVVWVEKEIVAIDTKGDHLIVQDAGRKLFHIKKIGTGPDLVIRLVTRGTWNDRIEKTDNVGFTVWLLRNGKAHPLHADDVSTAVQLCLRQG